MQVHSMEFKARAGQKLADQRLQQNLKKLSTKFVIGAAPMAISDDRLRRHARRAQGRRHRALDNLDVWLAKLRRKCDQARRHGAVRRDHRGGGPARWPISRRSMA